MIGDTSGQRLGGLLNQVARCAAKDQISLFFPCIDQVPNQRKEIGEALDLSKGVLYGLIAALPAGLPCPGCSEEMVFPNRTAREKGFLACPECEMEEEEGAVRAFWEGKGTGSAMQKAINSGKERVSNLSPRGRIIAGTALLGVAAGLVLSAYFRKR